MSLYTQNIQSALAVLNSSEVDIAQKIGNAKGRIEAFVERIKANALPAFNSALSLPEATANAVEGWADKFEHVVFLGMGGSSLGGKLINHYADATGLKPPHLHFIDYLSPCALETLAKELPLEKTGMIAISKSGGTAETLSQLFLLARAWEEVGLPLKNHLLAVTEPKTSALYDYATAHDIPILPHHPQLGGRYSIMGDTGTLPALLKGLDIKAFHKGMQSVVDDFSANPTTCAPAQGAALNAIAAEQGKNINVLYNYGERLRFLPAWFEQLWAESLGKEGKGTTPLGAVGPCSQHSIQQLFLAGPQDKLFTLVVPESNGWGKPVPEQEFKKDLSGVTPGALQQAMAEGTLQALIDRNQPVRTLILPKLKAENIGAILMHFMLETVLTACVWKIDPFDQPAVEESKKCTLEALAKLR